MSARSAPWRLVIPVTLSLLLMATGCGSSGGSNGDTSTSDTANSAGENPGESSISASTQLDGISVQAAKGAAPGVSLPSVPFSADRGYRVITPGTGAELTKDSILNVSFALVSGKDGKLLQASQADQATLRLSEPSLLADIRNTMTQQKVGAKVLIALPASESFGPEGNATQGVGPDDTLVFYFDVTSARTPATTATGTPVPPKAGLPTVVMGETLKDPATITVPKTAPPKTLIAQPLVVGKGAKVLKGQVLRVTYTGVTWANPGTPFDYSGKTDAGYADFQIGVGKLIKGWDEALVGQPVGSRMLLVVPPDKGYGAQGQGQGIKPNDTLVFVLDILDAG